MHESLSQQCRSNKLAVHLIAFFLSSFTILEFFFTELPLASIMASENRLQAHLF